MHADQMASISDVKGTKKIFSATYTRDKNGQVASDSSQAANQSSYQYTALNQLCYAGSSPSGACSPPPAGATPYSYSTADNLTKDGGTTQSFNAGNELCWTIPTSSSNGCTSAPTGATAYGYDNNGNTTSVTPPSGPAASLGYDQANRLTSYTYGATNASYSYNGDGLRMSKTVGGTT